MRTMMSGAAALTAAAALTLLSPLAAAADGVDGASMCLRGAPPQSLPTGSDVLDQMEGKYRLSNGQRVTLHRINHRLWIDFDRRRDMPLERVGDNQFMSRDGSVNLRYVPEREEISMRYPADARGRFIRAC